jgi:hypothetical protein
MRYLPILLMLYVVNTNEAVMVDTPFDEESWRCTSTDI